MQTKIVIVVEDDPITREEAATLLREAGFAVVALETADSALAYVWRQPNSVAAIFSDVETPGHTSGADLAQTVSCNWPNIVLLITSGKQRDSVTLPPSTQYLTKPWFPLDVLSALQRAA